MMEIGGLAARICAKTRLSTRKAQVKDDRQDQVSPNNVLHPGREVSKRRAFPGGGLSPNTLFMGTEKMGTKPNLVDSRSRGSQPLEACGFVSSASVSAPLSVAIFVFRAIGHIALPSPDQFAQLGRKRGPLSEALATCFVARSWFNDSDFLDAYE
jgi:hypothetical protein